MKLRDYLNRKIIPAFIGMFCCFALIGVGGAIAAERPSLIFVPILAIVGFAVGIVFLLYGVRCPQCRNRLGPLTSLPKAGYFRLSHTICFCPFCGISLDREVDADGQLVLPAERPQGGA